MFQEHADAIGSIFGKLKPRGPLDIRTQRGLIPCVHEGNDRHDLLSIKVGPFTNFLSSQRQKALTGHDKQLIEKLKEAGMPEPIIEIRSVGDKKTGYHYKVRLGLPMGNLDTLNEWGRAVETALRRVDSENATRSPPVKRGKQSP